MILSCKNIQYVKMAVYGQNINFAFDQIYARVQWNVLFNVRDYVITTHFGYRKITQIRQSNLNDV